ncbi:pro-sigmaK processing inhibitor BofA family protein [Shimazuella kribbensis]|uniref:pro-sigmaK processing inhibitor BofA family protein n=1 Tax=Shimazuella kribbensis TaxID=139808 RepID=UPI00040D5F30|nr:pro-sigmaK processing inhibitor BofA family protein [Shimazuella kribbensis]
MLDIKWWIIASIGGVLFFMLISRSVKQPLIWLWQGLLYSAIGSLVIFLINFIGQSFHFTLPINILTAIAVGFLRLPGLAYIVATKLFILP